MVPMSKKTQTGDTRTLTERLPYSRTGKNIRSGTTEGRTVKNCQTSKPYMEGCG